MNFSRLRRDNRHPMAYRLAASLAVVLAFAAMAISVSPAWAITDAEELTRFGSQGDGAGQLSLPKSGAADPTTGHLYVVSSDNARVDEFTPWGEFVKAFGWDVAPGAVNEQQELRVRAGAGQFRLGFGASTSADLPFDASAAAVEAALNGLASIGGAGGTASVIAAPGSASTPSVYVIAFKGALAGSDVAQLNATDGATPLSGGVPSTSLQVRTRADGTPAGGGLESCTAESGCQKGAEGSGAGQVITAASVAVDGVGDVYFGEYHSKRVQKFSSSGHFLAMFGGEVNKTAVKEREEQEANAEPVTVTPAEENLCSAGTGDECGAGVVGAGPGQFSFLPRVALTPVGAVLVADGERIQRFNTAGEFQSEIKVAGEDIRSLAADPVGGDLYVTYFSGSFVNPNKENVRILDPASGAEIGHLQVDSPEAIAIDPTGRAFVIDREVSGAGESKFRPQEVVEFDAYGSRVGTLAAAETVPNSGGKSIELRGLATNAAGDLYVANSFASLSSVIRAFGPGPVMFEAPPLVAPQITAQYAVSAGTDSAELRAQINPKFWSDTEYYLEYGAAPCFEGGCKAEPAPPGARLTSKVVGSPVTSGGVFLEGLTPGVTYHYRFVAQSGGGGPVFGLAGKSGAAAEATFTTYRAPQARSCPGNEAFRVGASAALPDCRAYEMVSPLAKANGDIVVLGNFETGLPAVLNQSSVAGEKLAYGSYRAFGDAQSAPLTVQYIATRGAGGWETHAISPPHTRATIGVPENTDTEFKVFSPDLCQAWLQSFADPPLGPGAPVGYSNLYRRTDSGCAPTSYEALNTVTPPNQDPGLGFHPGLQGVSADGLHVIYVANDNLTETAPAQPGTCVAEGAGCLPRLYAQVAGQAKVRYVCILPGGVALKSACTAGTRPESNGGFNASSLTGAISSDGSRVFWTAANGPGPIYLRENPFGGGVECAKATSPCTLAVSKAAEEAGGSSSSVFLAGAKDGSRALFTTGGSLYEYRVADSSTHLIAVKVLGALGVSEDATRVYLASREALDAGAVAGDANLYFYEAGEFDFIGSLSKADLPEARFFSPISSYTRFRTARVSPDGLHAAFMSVAGMTGYTNADVGSGKLDAEVFLYDSAANGGEGKLVCASCNPSGARPHGAAQIPVFQNALYAARVLSDDGGRLFFESYDSLLPADTNGRKDVYQWEAVGVGECTQVATSFSPINDGCIALISSGKSAGDSEFVDASPSGDDVFFATLSSLLPQDYGLVDIYDARQGGGFPAPPAPPAGCEGEACQSPPEAPNDPTPASSSFQGAGNVVEKSAKKKHKLKKRKKHKPKAKKQKDKKRAGQKSAPGNRGTR